MAAKTWSMKARDRRILGRGALLVLCASLAFHHLYAVLSPGVSDAADRPASPAQLQGLRDQIVGLQDQLAAKEAELQVLNSKIADIKVKMTGLGAIQDIGGNVAGGWNVGENVGMGTGRGALQFQLIAAESQRDAVVQQISTLQQRIAQVQATLTYWQNPVGTDLQNEREHLRNLQNQPATSDDDKQRQWDIDNTEQRIEELETLQQQFQQSGWGTSGGTSDGQSVQPQSSTYAAPTSGFGASGTGAQPSGSQGQYPGYGSGPYGTGSPVVDWQRQVPTSGAGGGGQPKNPCGGG